jgi:hypothetical protein
MLPLRLPESVNCALSVLPETNTESLSNDHSNTERQPLGNCDESERNLIYIFCCK